MGYTHFILLLAFFTLTYIFVALARRYALAKHIIDIPNARSSHHMPTPRGGGIAVAAAFAIACAVLPWAGYEYDIGVWTMFGCAIVIAIVGWVDDHRSLPVGARLVVHVAAATIFLYVVGGLSVVMLGDDLVAIGAVGSLLAGLWITWSTNLFNFMDGSDGIAGVQALFVFIASAFLFLTLGADRIAWITMVLAAAVAAFLMWNWPPAKIFMGDVCSGFLGFLLIVLPLVDQALVPYELLPWLSLNILFIIDATATLVRRALRGEKIVVAHRTHLYQRMIQAGLSHGQVAVGTVVINVCIVLPTVLYMHFIPSSQIAATLLLWTAGVIGWILAIRKFEARAIARLTGAR